MSNKKPILVKFLAYSLFGISGVFGVFSLIASLYKEPSTIISIIAYIAVSSLCIALGVGLLKRKKWARVISIIFFSIIVLSTFAALTASISLIGEHASAYDIASQIIAYSLPALISGFGLYTLVIDKSVKSYFD